MKMDAADESGRHPLCTLTTSPNVQPCPVTTTKDAAAVAAAVAAALSVASNALKPCDGQHIETETIETVVHGPISLQHLLGTGGFGKVWSGRIMRSGEAVAVKIVEHTEGEEVEVLADVAREAAAHERLYAGTPPRDGLLVRLLCTEQLSRSSVMVLELVSGRTLDEHVLSQPNGRLLESEAVRIASDLAEALAFCHRAGLAHLDVKPSNAIVGGAHNTTLIDYGASATFDASRPPSTQWVDLSVGTENFMSPERQFEEYEHILGPPADVYSLGCVVFFMLFGAPPYDWEGANT